MNTLVIGSGGREHAIAWKMSQSPRVKKVFVAPGNAGTALERDGSKIENVPISENDIAALISFARQNKVTLTVVGPEKPLCAGIIDAFEAERLRIFGPNKNAARLEGSKIFCKEILRRGNVPTGNSHSFDFANRAIEYLENGIEMPLVVKADGLAAGKGVIVCDNREEAIAAVRLIAVERSFGDAGNKILIEERLDGPEVSVLAITDGSTIVRLAPAQDHKAAYDGDKGPNTGGMGAYSPALVFDDKMSEQITSRVLVPTLHSLRTSGVNFKGVMYAGLMMTKQGPRVLEYNVRFGDPECQPILMRLKTDIVDVFEAAIDNRLDKLPPLEWDTRTAVCVVMASRGYPGDYEKGKPITGLDAAAKIEDVKVFHAGTTMNASNEVVTNGGRVLGVTALGENPSEAKNTAYKAVKCIRWDGAWCRKDISDKSVQ
ncbi:MAG: phosphoribosylamine--glycine ligase [Planctomycetaceae bacterium]|jgi:phosphoribosylamine--glycine ligase|nr:phosphoribosylamine--glycine ligase [Planctomycetaceae bacterium]